MKLYDRLTQPFEFKYQDVHLIGVSSAGVGTSFVWPELKLCFDVAQGLPFAYNAKQYLITHAHMDHAGGLPYIVSQKAMTSQQAPNIYLPASATVGIRKIMQCWSELEKHEYQYNLIESDLDTKVEINKAFVFQAFPTSHRVDSNGYTVYRRKKKLKKAYQQLEQKALNQVREAGEEITEEVFTPIFSFTGDTTIEFLDLSEDAKNSQVLMLEVTYMDDQKSVESAKKRGHIHLKEVLPRLSEIKSKKIILMHLSLRHEPEELEKLLDRVLNPKDRKRVVVWGGRT